MKHVKSFAEILNNQKIGEGFYDLRVQSKDICNLAETGQFVNIFVDDKTLRRPISICGIDRENSILRMVYEIRGEGTAWLSERNPGEILDILGPLGQGFKLKGHKNVIVVGGGIGVPPLLQIANTDGINITAVLGFRNSSAAVLLDDFNTACKSVHVTSDDGSIGQKGFVTSILAELLETEEADLICACGPTPMLKAVAKMGEDKGIETQVSMEQRMGCGIGACLVCSCKVDMGAGETYAQVCRNGPVFNSKEVIW